MIVYPAIDILDGKCVRLAQGKYDDVTVYSENPVEFVKFWITRGALFIHVVDLNGARSGMPVNDLVIREIVKESSVPIQVGGGIRTMERIDALLDLGVNRVILGTGAVKNPALVEAAVEKYGDRIVIGIDAKDGYVAIDGWENKSIHKAVDFALKMDKLGVKTIIYTDISRDGMLTGPNLEAMEVMAGSVGCDIIASGGVGCIEDISALSTTGVSGVITGKALYENRLDLAEAQELFNQNTD